MNEIDWKILFIVASLCCLIGAVVQWKFQLNWFAVATLIQGVIWLSGLWASEDEPWPGDESYPHEASSEEYQSDLKSIKIQKAMICVAFLASIITWVLTSNAG